jgi:cytochrome c
MQVRQGQGQRHGYAWRRGAIAAAACVSVGGTLASGCAAKRPDGQPPRQIVGGDAARGKQAIVAYGCGACHEIPGIREAEGLVGPPLTRFANRAYIAGEVPNTPDQLVRWIMVPQAIEPKTAMPVLGVSAAAARDIAAYLYTLR